MDNNNISVAEATEIGRKFYQEKLLDFIKNKSFTTKINGKTIVVINSDELLEKITNNTEQ